MNAKDHADAQLEIIRQYWRVKAAVALLTTAAPPPLMSTTVVVYDGVPAVGFPANWISNETVGSALTAMLAHADGRLPRDCFMAQIAVFEQRISSVLSGAGKPAEGTLGTLLNRIEDNWVISTTSKELAAEFRCRRNVLVHSNGLADQKYVIARSAAAAHRPRTLQMPVALGDLIAPDLFYLSHCTEAMLLYSSELP